MTRRILIFVLAFLLILPCGCARKSVTPGQLLSALTDAEIGLPAGQIYLSDAAEDQAEYLSDELMAALYGQGELPWQLSLVERYGIFLSTAQHPCEFAVFVCFSRSDTDLVAAMCQTRLDDLRAFYQGSEYAAYLQDAKVAIIGKHVLLLISADAQHALDTARRVI